MPKKNNTLIDATRQQIKRILADRLKAENKARKLRAKNKKKNELREIAIRARALKKLGLYNPKDSIKQSTITPAKKRRINKAFFDLQRHAKFVEKGHTVRPLTKVDKVGKNGRVTQHYQLNKNFQLVRTKKKTNAISGVIKTKKGYLVEKDTPDSIVRINKKTGEIVQSRANKKGPRTITRRKGIKGKAIAEFVDDIENNRIKIKPNQHLVYHRFGWTNPNNTQAFDHDELDMFAELVFRVYEVQMSPKVFADWMDASELLIRDN
jgi:hypothetical protein